MTGIYKISCSNSSKIYIGSAVNFKNRQRLHIVNLTNKTHHNAKLQAYANKYSIEDFKFELIEECTKENLLSHEQFYIDILNPFFNISKTAGSNLGMKYPNRKPIHDADFKIRLAERNKNRIWSEESKKKNSDAKKGHAVTTQWIEAIKKANTGRKFTQEHKDKIGRAQIGRVINEKTRLAVAESNRRRTKIKLAA